MGTRGFGGVSGALARSVSWRLAAQAHGPLLAVRGDHPCDGGREVLLGLESDADTEAAAYAFREAARRGARLRVPHSATHRHTTPDLPSLVAATSPGQERQARNDRSEEAVPRLGIARLREDRYRLVMDVIDRVPGLAVRAAAVRQRMEDTRLRHHDWIRVHGTDLPEVADWTWDG